ncbi:MAG: dienelactone hydrolase family protein [Nitrospirae bacterium]|nr:dienelactone hydrolase family protein [Nitrospirota bacterium]
MFTDRRDAGLQLAEKLKHYKSCKGVLVLALPRGGAVTGLEIARTISAPLDVLIVRKIGFPGQPELAIGAVSETGTVVLNQRIISDGGVTKKYIEDEISAQKKEIDRRIRLYRGGRRVEFEKVEGKTIILVDDGIATGATMKAAIATLKEEKIEKLIVAVPVSPLETANELRAMVDEFVCLYTPSDFMAVGNYYRDFTQVTDEEVAKILKESVALKEGYEMTEEKQVKIPVDSVKLEGILTIPKDALSLVIFAHGSGSSRLSPRNRFVAGVLQKAGMGTLLFDLLTAKEDEIYDNRFDIPLITGRLKAATHWVMGQSETAKLKIGYFGASTGTAVALVAAADFAAEIKAIVSRGGRPDLAGDALGKVIVPTLLIVGGEDHVVIELNKKAFDMIKAEKQLKIIPGATHLFEEPGTLEAVARLAAEWFKKYLTEKI